MKKLFLTQAAFPLLALTLSCSGGDGKDDADVDVDEASDPDAVEDPADVPGEENVEDADIVSDGGADGDEDPGPECGDGSCNGLEECTTCPDDCGECPEPVCDTSVLPEGDCREIGCPSGWTCESCVDMTVFYACVLIGLTCCDCWGGSLC